MGSFLFDFSNQQTWIEITAGDFLKSGIAKV